MHKTQIPSVVNARQLEEILRERADVRLLDVRTPGEYETVHIRGAYNVPLDTLGEHSNEIRASVDAPVVLICQSGNRARQAELALKECTMRNVHVLEGGMNGWLAEGLPAERGAERLSLERQVRVVAGGMAAAGALLALVVNPLFAVVPAFVGSGLVFAGVTDTCGMAMVLSRLPYNRAASCDVPAMVEALKNGARPAGLGRASRAESPAARSCAA
ncbi:MAG TPA: rhodanese-like domain-containing protein [Longimicrobiales bacterium]|nr:rhodanese-like domain-containing protein [Longimicrobiales bacterium]